MQIKKQKLKKSLQTVVLPLAISLSLISQVSATSVKPVPDKQAISQSKIKEVKADKQIIKEAADAFKATETALKALENDQPKQAMAALEVVSGNLHLLLARDPALDLIPIDVQIQAIDGIHDLKVIKKLEVDLKDLINDGRFQAARPILDSLVDELRVTTIYLPLATYPAAIDQIAPLIDAGKNDEARQGLVDVLSTYVIEEEVTPLTIISAEGSLTEAFQIEHEGDLKNKKTKNKIEKLINEAKYDIKIAETLGYGTKDDYAILYEGIDALNKAIGTSGFKGEWQKLKKSLSRFKNKIVHPGS